MTIQMLRQFNGLSFDEIYTLAGAEETRLVGIGMARFYSVGGDGVSGNTLSPSAATAIAGGNTVNDAAESWYDTGGTGGPLWVYENAEAALPVLQANRNTDVNRVIFIDPVSGSDANAGTINSPKLTRRPSLWTGAVTNIQVDDYTLFKRGTTYIHGDAGGGIDINARQHIGSYGQLTDPRPLLRSMNAASLPYVVTMQGNSTSFSDCDIDASDLTNRSGIFVGGDGVIDAVDRMISNSRITGVTQTGTNLRAGIRFSNGVNNLASNRSAAYPLMYDIDCINVDVEGVGYHGFHTFGAVGKLINGVWRSVRFTGSRAVGCSTQYDGHGFSQFALGTVRDVLASYTQVLSTTVYFLSTAQIFGGATGTGGAAGTTTVPDVDIVYQRTASPSIQVFLLRKNTVTPTTPAIGEFGFDNATQRVYVNVGVALPTGANVGFNLDACTNSCNGLVYNRCQAKDTKWPQATAVQEGHGFACDDLASNNLIINCESINNAGLGISWNRGLRNRAFNNRLYDNARGPIGGTGIGHRVWGNYAKGSGFTTGGLSNKSMISLVPPVYLFKDEPIIIGGFNNLEYTGTDPSVYLVAGSPDFSAPVVQFQHSIVAPGVGKIAGYGANAGEGGFVFARGLELKGSGNSRKMVAPSFTGY